MIVTLNWLSEYVDIKMSAKDLAELLTMAGLEVEEVVPVGQGLGEIVAARVLQTAPHPHGERLSLCQVDTGSEIIQVVCGATNLKEGVLVPFARPQVRLPAGIVVEESVIRGEVSRGMLLAEDEMGLTPDHSGVMILPDDSSLGATLPSILPVSDWILNVSITPNRPDCASTLGIAREIAAATGKALRRPEIDLVEDGPAIDGLTRVTILDPVGCPRYAAGFIQGIRVGVAPFWMRYRLHLCGMRSINTIVDITNYVMLELGQPLHAFDYHRLRQNQIVVKRANEGEAFTTLDDQVHTLCAEHLMICDAERSVAMAGIMGGMNSEIFPDTKDVLLESACFDPLTIRRGAKRLGISTEASYRFERGTDIEGVIFALQRSLALISRYAGGSVAKGIVDSYPKPYKKNGDRPEG